MKDLKKKYLVFFTFIIAAFACDDELNVKPQQSLSDQLIFSGPITAEGALIGTYNLLQDLHVFGSMPQIIADYATDNVQFVGTFTGLQEINTFSVTASAGEINEIWRDTYEAILSANSVIAFIEEVPGIDEDDAQQFKGEAHFIRAICYLQLVNLFGQPYNVGNGANPGVPLYLEPFTGEIILLSRNTVAEVYAQIIADLDEAQALIPADFNEPGRASVQGAVAYESRVRLYRGEYAEAAELANAVILGGVYDLAADYTFYNTTDNENIFAIQNITVDFENQSDPESGSGSWDGYYEPNDQGGRGDAPFSPDLDAAFAAEPGDLRAALREEGTTFSGLPAEFTTKYDFGTTDESDPSLMRFSEMLLNRAEALAEINGVNQESIDLMNEIRGRAGLADWTLSTFGNGPDLVNAILTERRKELAFEGHRRMDLLRRGLPLRTSTSAPPNALGAGVGITAGDDRAIYPIPQRERDNNDLLDQNNGY